MFLAQAEYTTDNTGPIAILIILGFVVFVLAMAFIKRP